MQHQERKKDDFI